MPLTAEDIARLTCTPVRTVRDRLARWRRAGAAVIALPSRGGRPPLGIAREDYARLVGIDPAHLDA